MRLLGIDYGKKRIGIAISDENQEMAFPQEVLENTKNVIEVLSQKIEDKNIERIVIGKSIDNKGMENKIMSDIKLFAKALSEKTNLPISFEDERFSTMAATQIQGRHEKIDASAAAIILEGYIERKKKNA